MVPFTWLSVSVSKLVPLLRRPGDVFGKVRKVMDDFKAPPGRATGFGRAEIEQIKNHVFEDLHPLEGVDGGTVMARFDPSPDMAEAWLRLRSGKALPEDVALLEHELAEARHWQQNPNASYQDAHAAANQVSRWETQVPPASDEDYSEPWR